MGIEIKINYDRASTQIILLHTTPKVEQKPGIEADLHFIWDIATGK